ncbi:hypothetical protein CY34DRAFT_802048, partial [Suillus luteus UH-Slu-Lm8-n1]
MRPSLPTRGSESKRRQVKRDEYSSLTIRLADVVSCKAAAHRLSVYRRPTMYQNANIPSETRTCTVRVSSPRVGHVLNARRVRIRLRLHG